MTIHKLNEHRCISGIDLHENQYGETPLPFAPRVELDNGNSAIPQQFLQVRRTRQSVEKIVSEIAFSADYPLFVGEENGVLYLQAGVIGKENYPSTLRHKVTPKIVYGRKWLIEVNTPTSEVVQTALLAIKKVREHEVREKFFLATEQSPKTTPFNTHMDLPLMAHNAKLFRADARLESLADLFSRISFSELSVTLQSDQQLANKQFLVDVKLEEAQQKETVFPELIDQHIHLIVDSLTKSELMHALMAALIQKSDQYIEQDFTFNGFNRFSLDQCPERIAEFSLITRNPNEFDQRFMPLYKDMTRQVDYDRAPEFSTSQLGDQQRKNINRFSELDGHLPKEPSSVVLSGNQETVIG